MPQHALAACHAFQHIAASACCNHKLAAVRYALASTRTGAALWTTLPALQTRPCYDATPLVTQGQPAARQPHTQMRRRKRPSSGASGKALGWRRGSHPSTPRSSLKTSWPRCDIAEHSLRLFKPAWCPVMGTCQIVVHLRSSCSMLSARLRPALTEAECNCSVVGQHEPTTWKLPNLWGSKLMLKTLYWPTELQPWAYWLVLWCWQQLKKIAAMCLPTGCIEPCDLKQFML